MPHVSASLTARSTDLSLLHPVVRKAVEAVLADLQKAKIPLFVFEAFRSPERQAYLYAQGRTRPGGIVTYAKPWQSYHQYGLAVDLVFGGPGAWTWDEPRRGMWRQMHEIGAKHGLMRLDFETPHLQLAGTSSGALQAGAYPTGGDRSWVDNLNAAISGWRRSPPAPPKATLAARVARRASSGRALLAARLDPSPADNIAALARASTIARYRWRDRGRAPAGYTIGMALTWARIYAQFTLGDRFATAMARKVGDEAKDALAWYRDKFDFAADWNGAAGVTTLRLLFVLLFGLGMRESSGRYCEGRDRSASNTTAETAEAGLFQTSYNARSSDPLLPKLFERYKADPRGLRDFFSEDVTCRPRDWENYGQGAGAEFQDLSKKCPAFAVELAALGVRSNRRHWGPLNRKEAEVRAACNDLLLEIQSIVDLDPQAYAGLQ